MPDEAVVAPALCPRLVCSSPDAAIEFYQQVLGAKLLERFATPDGVVVHAALALRGSVFSLTQEDRDTGNLAPESLGGSPVLMQLDAPDPDAIERAAKDRGASVMIPVADQFYGRREGRFRDPFGHLWMIGKEIEKLSDSEVQDRLDQQG